MFKTQVDTVLGILLEVTLLEQGLDGMISRGVLQPQLICDSVWQCLFKDRRCLGEGTANPGGNADCSPSLTSAEI